jgi:hypothetical protein
MAEMDFLKAEMEDLNRKQPWQEFSESIETSRRMSGFILSD